MIEYDYEKLKKIIYDRFMSQTGEKDNSTLERFQHSLGVCDMALKLNKMHNLNVDENKIICASLLHDYAKFNTKEEIKEVCSFYGVEFDEKASHKLWHGFYGPLFIKKELGIEDKEILDAVYYHTTGRSNMSDLEKLIYISDFTEINTRHGEEFEKIREMSYISLDKAVLQEAEFTISHLKKDNRLIEGPTLATYTYYKEKMEKNNG